MDKLVFLYVSTLRRKNYKDMKRASLFFFFSLPYLIAIGYTSEYNISFIYAKSADICNVAYLAGMRVVRNSTFLLLSQHVLLLGFGMYKISFRIMRNLNLIELEKIW